MMKIDSFRMQKEMGIVLGIDDTPEWIIVSPDIRRSFGFSELVSMARLLSINHIEES